MNTHLLKDLAAFPDLLGLDPRHQRTVTPGFLLSVSDRDLLAVDLGHLDASQLRNVVAFLILKMQPPPGAFGRKSTHGGKLMLLFIYFLW